MCIRDSPKVVFHSFRHSSITYKLKLNGGDIKAVQGDSGPVSYTHLDVYKRQAVTCSMDEWKKHTVSVPLLNVKQFVARSMTRK